MNSWRDAAAPVVQQDLDDLFDAALRAASQFLVRHGEFFPFGWWIKDDDMALFAADPGIGEQPSSHEVVRALAEAADAERERLRAVAIACDVVLPDGGDAVRVQLEHREGVALEVLVPYRRRRFSRKLTHGEMKVSSGDARLWTS